MSKLQTLPPDFKEFIALLLEREVKFLIVGGYAVSAHGRPRYTGDIDIFIESSPENAQKLASALHNFFGELPEIQPENFLDPERMSQFGVEPLRIDILNAIDGIKFSEAYARKVHLSINQLNIPFISLEDLRLNKAASGRHKDLNDLEEHLPKA